MFNLFFATLTRRLFASVMVSAMVVVFTTTGSMAAGLGKLRTESLIGELLQANVTISGLGETALKSARVSIAPDEVWQSAGVKQGAALASLRFRVDPKTSSIEITSVAPLRQPSVDVILELSTGTVRVQRWYTIAPAVASVVSNAAKADVASVAVVSGQPAQVKPENLGPEKESIEIAPENRIQVLDRSAMPRAMERAPESTQSSNQRVFRTTPSAAANKSSSKAVPAARSAFKNGLYGPVKSGETLFSIASSNQPAGVTINQAMAAIIRTNPQLFGGGVRAMPAGANIYIPPKSVMLLVSDRKAKQQVRGISALKQPAKKPARAVKRVNRVQKTSRAEGSAADLESLPVAQTLPLPGEAAIGRPAVIVLPRVKSQSVSVEPVKSVTALVPAVTTESAIAESTSIESTSAESTAAESVQPKDSNKELAVATPPAAEVKPQPEPKPASDSAATTSTDTFKPPVSSGDSAANSAGEQAVEIEAGVEGIDANRAEVTTSAAARELPNTEVTTAVKVGGAAGNGAGDETILALGTGEASIAVEAGTESEGNNALGSVALDAASEATMGADTQPVSESTIEVSIEPEENIELAQPNAAKQADTQVEIQQESQARSQAENQAEPLVSKESETAAVEAGNEPSVEPGSETSAEVSEGEQENTATESEALADVATINNDTANNETGTSLSAGDKAAELLGQASVGISKAVTAVKSSLASVQEDIRREPLTLQPLTPENYVQLSFWKNYFERLKNGQLEAHNPILWAVFFILLLLWLIARGLGRSRRLENADATKAEKASKKSEQKEGRSKGKSIGKSAEKKKGDYQKSKGSADKSVSSRPGVKKSTNQNSEAALASKDPLGDADFHLSYGMFPQALSLLRQAQASDDVTPELKDELFDKELEVLVAQADESAFLQRIDALRGSASENVVSKFEAKREALWPTPVSAEQLAAEESEAEDSMLEMGSFTESKSSVYEEVDQPQTLELDGPEALELDGPQAPDLDELIDLSESTPNNLVTAESEPAKLIEDSILDLPEGEASVDEDLESFLSSSDPAAGPEGVVAPEVASEEADGLSAALADLDNLADSIGPADGESSLKSSHESAGNAGRGEVSEFEGVESQGTETLGNNEELMAGLEIDDSALTLADLNEEDASESTVEADEASLSIGAGNALDIDLESLSADLDALKSEQPAKVLPAMPSIDVPGLDLSEPDAVENDLALNLESDNAESAPVGPEAATVELADDLLALSAMVEPEQAASNEQSIAEKPDAEKHGTEQSRAEKLGAENYEAEQLTAEPSPSNTADESAADTTNMVGSLDDAMAELNALVENSAAEKPSAPAVSIENSQTIDGTAAKASPAAEISFGDVLSTQLDLARAYVDMGDKQEAQRLLGTVLSRGSDQQVAEAHKLLKELG